MENMATPLMLRKNLHGIIRFAKVIDNNKNNFIVFENTQYI